jgi:hypothetical protein
VAVAFAVPTAGQDIAQTPTIVTSHHKVTIRIPASIKAHTAQPCDLRGQDAGSPIEISAGGAFDVTISHMAPASLILQTEWTSK